MTKPLNFPTNLLFGFILLFGLGYTFLLVLLAFQLSSGFIMQIIFLFDAVKSPSAFISLITSFQFLLNFGTGLILLVLISRYLRSLIRLISQVRTTSQFVSRLPIISSCPQYFTFTSSHPLIFTAGWFHPQIYLSSSLFQTHTPTELRSMLLHEQNHQHHLHPLKLLLVNFFNHTLFQVAPFHWLVSQFITLTEVSSDSYAYRELGDKNLLVTSLIKFHQLAPNSFHSLALNFFDSQSQRLRVLVGKQTQPLFSPLGSSALLAGLTFYLVVFFSLNSVFYQCSHLYRCFQDLFSPAVTISAPDHCQSH
jgi:Zn-dependent protease with chaperone function